MGHPGWTLRPLVLDHSAVPVIRDVRAGQDQPELLVLSALAHGGSPEGEPVLKTVAEVLPALPDEDKSAIYIDFVLAALPDAARKTLEALMSAGTWEWQSDFAQKYVGIGKEEGKAEGEAEAILAFLAARGIDVPDHVAARVRACTDLDRLRTWIRRAATVTTADQLFTES